MALLIPNRQVWTRQPQRAVRVNRGHPLAIGLVAVILPSGSHNELLSGISPTIGGTSPVRSPGVRGVSVDNTSTDGVYAYDSTDGRWASGSQTHFVLFDAVSANEWAGILGSCNAAGTLNSFALSRYSSGTGMAIFTDGGDPAAYQFGSINDFIGVGPVSLSISGLAGSTTARVVRNGAVYATPTLTADPEVHATSRLTTLSERQVSPANNVSGRWYLRLAWNRQLSAAEDHAVHQNPWQLFEPEDAPVFYSLSSSSPVTINGNLAEADATGLSGNVASPITVAGSVAPATAAGLSGSVASPVSIAGSVAQATATGRSGTVSSPVTISGQTGAAVAAGLQGTVSSGATIAGSVGAATAAGLTGSVASPISVAGQVGAAVAVGLAGSVSTQNEIAGQVGRATAAGLKGAVSSPVTISGSVAPAVATGLSGTVGTGATIQGNTAAAIALGLGGTVTNNPIILGAVGLALARGLQGSVTSGALVVPPTSRTLRVSAENRILRPRAENRTLRAR